MQFEVIEYIYAIVFFFKVGNANNSYNRFFFASNENTF
jgi:hypothetical protein